MKITFYRVFSYIAHTKDQYLEEILVFAKRKHDGKQYQGLLDSGLEERSTVNGVNLSKKKSQLKILNS